MSLNILIWCHLLEIRICLDCERCLYTSGKSHLTTPLCCELWWTVRTCFLPLHDWSDKFFQHVNGNVLKSEVPLAFGFGHWFSLCHCSMQVHIFPSTNATRRDTTGGISPSLLVVNVSLVHTKPALVVEFSRISYICFFCCTTLERCIYGFYDTEMWQEQYKPPIVLNGE